MKDIQEQSKFIVNRFDHYFDSINNKGVFYITINTFLLGGLFTQVEVILNAGNKSWWIYTLVLGFVLINVFSNILTILSINPFKSPKCDDSPSLIYFHDIACKELKEFTTEFASQSDAFLNKDFSNQIHQLAGGLNIKFDRLRYAGLLLLLQFVSLIPIVFVTILNEKK